MMKFYGMQFDHHNFNCGMLNDDDTWLDLKGAMRDDRMVVYCVLSFKSDSQLSSSSSSWSYLLP